MNLKDLNWDSDDLMIDDIGVIEPKIQTKDIFKQVEIINKLAKHSQNSTTKINNQNRSIETTIMNTIVGISPIKLLEICLTKDRVEHWLNTVLICHLLQESLEKKFSMQLWEYPPIIQIDLEYFHPKGGGFQIKKILYLSEEILEFFLLWQNYFKHLYKIVGKTNNIICQNIFNILCLQPEKLKVKPSPEFTLKKIIEWFSFTYFIKAFPEIDGNYYHQFSPRKYHNQTRKINKLNQQAKQENILSKNEQKEMLSIITQKEKEENKFGVRQFNQAINIILNTAEKSAKKTPTLKTNIKLFREAKEDLNRFYLKITNPKKNGTGFAWSKGTLLNGNGKGGIYK